MGKFDDDWNLIYEKACWSVIGVMLMGVFMGVPGMESFIVDLEASGAPESVTEGGNVSEEGNMGPVIPIEEICWEPFTMGAPSRGIHLVSVNYTGPMNMTGFYDLADELFPQHGLMNLVEVETLEEAWAVRESVYHDIMVLGGSMVDNEGEIAWGHTCGFRGYVGVYQDECPWRVALHELGHLVGHVHEHGGVMSNEHCNQDAPNGLSDRQRSD